ncbi:MAG TPA: trimethylamine methyltransferase family protein [Thermoleophilia bacterium]|nr:trimethylamine methyltransferase family protein [Thermoleophilia bacterium]
MARTLRVQPLSSDDVDSILEKAVRILTDHGVKVDYEKALERLAAAGANVDMSTRMVRFPKDTIEAALASVPKSVKVMGGDEKHDFTVPDPSGKFFSTTCVQTMRYFDPDVGDYVANTTERFAEWCQLVEQLPNINVCAIQTPMDVPPETADVHGLNVQLQNTSKPLMLLAYCHESVPYLFELMLARAGSAEALRKRPLLLINPTSLSPLVYKDMDMAQLLGAAEYDIPVAANSLAIAGATAPVTIAGTVLLEAVELLAFLVMSQMFKPGLPFIATVFNTTMDLGTGNALLANSETILARAATVQFCKEAFGVPVETFSMMADSYVPDGQTAAEKTLQPAILSMAGADILYGAGRLGGSTLASPVELVIDDRLLAVIQRTVSGVQVDDETLAMDDIIEAGPGGHFLRRKHTLRHCREMIRPDLFVPDVLDNWMAAGRKDLYERATEKYQEMRKTLQPIELPDDVKRDMDAVVKAADKHLAG